MGTVLCVGEVELILNEEALPRSRPRCPPRRGRGGHMGQEGAEGKLDWGGRGDGFYVALKCRLPLAGVVWMAG